MTQAVVNLEEYADRIVNIIKGKYGLKNKSEAVNYIIDKYGDNMLEPELKPEYIKKAEKIKKQKAIPVNDFAKRYRLE